jgi:hypothetical protein
VVGENGDDKKMYPHIEKVRRHGNTMTGKSGNKLDQPTAQGIARLYSWGKDLREEFPNHQIKGVHSEADRTYISVASVLMGAGITSVDEYLTETSALNVLIVPKNQLQQLRNMTDVDARNKIIFDDLRDVAKEAGTRIAAYLVKSLQAAVEQEDQVLDVKFSHGPPMEAAYLVLTGQPISYNNVTRMGGILEEKGFDLGLRRDGRLVDIKLQDNPIKTYDLADLVGMVG